MAACTAQLSLARGAYGIMPAIYPTRLHLNTGNAMLDGVRYRAKPGFPGRIAMRLSGNNRCLLTKCHRDIELTSRRTERSV